MQKNYWIEHTADLTVEAMMLDSQASYLDKEERPEVILLPACSSLSLASFLLFELIVWFVGRRRRFIWSFRSVFSVLTVRILMVTTVYMVE